MTCKNLFRIRFFKVLCLVLFISLLTSGASDASVKMPRFPNGQTAPGKILRVVDGDTLRIDIPPLGDTAVRLIGIDTPECRRNKRADLQSQESSRDIEVILEMGKKASSYMKSLVRKGDAVLLTFDTTSKDRYGRLLAYVWKDNIMLNAVMVRDGYASPLTIPPNVAYADLFKNLYREAREEGLGLWSN